MSDPQHDVHTCAIMLAEALLHSSTTPLPTEVAKANTYIHEKLMNYFVLMRKQLHLEAVTFMIPAGRPLQEAGWYYKAKGLSADAFNWNGPYPSRKDAQQARDLLKGQPKTSYQVLEREIFGEVITTDA